jgi:outer membrane protein assembly factor BamB
MLTRGIAASFCALAVLLAGSSTFAAESLDVSGATRIKLPSAGNAPVTFKTADGKEGWVRRLSNEPIPTPAFAKGRIYTGAGMGQSTFYAIDAESGATVWEKPTEDNGPTSPVVSDKYVAYNLESCHTETRDEDTGEMLWSEITGDSLLTQPGVLASTLIIPHPTRKRTTQFADDSFRMLSVDLKTGHHFNDRNMTADVLTAPIAAGERIFFTCVDGRLFCLQTGGGSPGWHVVAKATSAPVVVGDVVAVTTEENRGGGTVVSIQRYTVSDGTLLDEKPLASTVVGKGVLSRGQRAEWDYQGPKIAAAGKQMFYAPGQTVNAVDVTSGKTMWRTMLSGNGLSSGANSLTPPALGKENLYLGSNKGHIIALKQADGSQVFSYNVGEPLASQPILAHGNIYFGTVSGYLVCLKLQNPDADGWTAWGGNAQHNKVD